MHPPPQRAHLALRQPCARDCAQIDLDAADKGEPTESKGAHCGEDGLFERGGVDARRPVWGAPAKGRAAAYDVKQVQLRALRVQAGGAHLREEETEDGRGERG
eukprot:6207849-Pleurochrysis_carterae.AAC.1